MRTERRAVRLAVRTASALVLAAVVLRAQSPQPAARVGKIEILPGTATVKLILVGDGQLPVARAYYPADSPRTFVIDLEGARTSAAPSVPPSEAPLIKDVQVQELGQRDLRILVRLKERVPVKIGTEAGRAVV